MIPDWVGWILENVVGIGSLPLDTQVLTVVGWTALWLYFVAFLTFGAMRRMVRRWDRADYQSLTGQEPTVQWATSDTASNLKEV